VVIISFKERKRGPWKKQVRNMVISISVGILLASVFYVPNSRLILEGLLYAYSAGLWEGDPEGITPIYVTYLINIQ
jgi:hypothetical protein